MTMAIARLACAGAVVLAAGCAQLGQLAGTDRPGDAPPATPVAPQITEDTLRTRAQEQLARGIAQYQAGEYDNAVRSLMASLDHGLLSKSDQARARKLLAFSHCVSGREAQCRDEFRKAFEIFPEFALTPAEDGHPIWGPVYRNVRTQLIAEREAAQQRQSGFLPQPKAEQMMGDGLVKYDSGDYDSAARILDAAFKEGLKEKRDQVRALKHVAFSLCLLNRYKECRAAFARVYEVEPTFDLTPAESGHPSWTRTFAGVKKAQQDRLAREAREKAAKEARERSKAPPTASVPKAAK